MKWKRLLILGAGINIGILLCTLLIFPSPMMRLSELEQIASEAPDKLVWTATAKDEFFQTIGRTKSGVGSLFFLATICSLGNAVLLTIVLLKNRRTPHSEG